MSSRNQAVIKLCHETIFISVEFFFLWKKSFNFAEAFFVAAVILWPTHKQLSKWRKQNTNQTTPPPQPRVFTTLFGGCVCVCSVAQSCLTLEACWTEAHQAPLSMEFFQKRILSRLSFPVPRDLPNPGVEPESLVSRARAGDASPPCHLRSPTFFGTPHCFLLSSKRGNTAISLSVTAH